MTQVTILPIKSSADKCRALCHIALKHLEKKEKLQMLVPTETALLYIDNLLWKEPKTSFLPHSCNFPILYHDFLLLSLESNPSYEYPAVFNLCEKPYLLHAAKTIYELEESFHPNKKACFQNKFLTYQKLGFTINNYVESF